MVQFLEFESASPISLERSPAQSLALADLIETPSPPGESQSVYGEIRSRHRLRGQFSRLASPRPEQREGGKD